MFLLRKPAREDERGEFHGPEEAVSVEVVDGYAVIRCSQETTARAARRRGWVDVEDVVASVPGADEPVPVDEPLDEAPSTTARSSSRRRR